MPYDSTRFLGTAPYYLRGRPPYSAELGPVLAAEVGLDGTGELVDVGTGPGTVGVQLAAWFTRVRFVEPDRDMLAAARAHAAAAGLADVEFVAATAEELPGLRLPPPRVVTFGQSFHHTDRVRVAEAVHALLRPGGALVLISHDPDRPVPPQPPGTSVIPHEDVRRLIRRHLGHERPSGAAFAPAEPIEPFEQTLARTSFGPPRVLHAPGRRDLVRDVEDVVADVLSKSYAAPHLFGARSDAFVDDLRRLLTAHSPAGRFWDWPGDTRLVVARRR